MYLRSLLSPQQREEAVGLFERGYGAWFVATRLCVPEGRVARLYDRWRIHGRLCLMNKPTRTQHSYEKKKVVVERVLAGESKPALAQEFQLSSPKLIDAWVRRYRDEGASLSSFLCKCGGWGLEVGLDSVGVGECELAECLFPVRDDESFNQTSLGKSFGSSGQSAFFCSVTSPFVFDIADRQPQ